MSPFFRFPSSEESYGFVFWQTYVLWSRKVKRALKPFQLTHTQFVILNVILYLQQSQSLVSQSDVAKMSKIDKMTVSTSIKTLQKNGYICVNDHEKDGRANGLLLSSLGKSTQQQAIQIVEEIDEQFFGKANIELNQFIYMLHELQHVNHDSE